MSILILAMINLIESGSLLIIMLLLVFLCNSVCQLFDENSCDRCAQLLTTYSHGRPQRWGRE